ncbi:MAG: hypothetical protein M3R24_20860, partial [Chloroflexota bacterium]|nr:hypothetical protein [Chloroflexota bacterium]
MKTEWVKAAEQSIAPDALERGENSRLPSRVPRGKGHIQPHGAPDTLCQFPGLYNSRTHLPVPYHSVSPLTYEYCFVHPWLC